jgi:hypothetical protein
MPMTLEQALEDSRTLYGEPSGAVFTDQMIVDWLSLGQQTVAALTLGVERRVRFLASDALPFFVPGVREYRFEAAVGSGGFGLPTAIRGLQVFLNGIDLPLWTAKMITQADPLAKGNGQPQYWYQFGPVVGFIPLPDTLFLTRPWVLDCVYADLPGVWEHGPGVLPSGLDELPALFAVTRMLLARRQWQRASQVYSQFLMLIRSYRQHTLYRGQTSLEEMRQSTERERHDTPRLPTMRELRAIQGGRGR